RDFHVTGVQTCALPISDFIVRRPRVLKTTINTTVQKNTESVVPKFKITVQNPASQAVKGKLILDIEGMPQKKVDVEIPPRQTLRSEERRVGKEGRERGS